MRLLPRNPGPALLLAALMLVWGVPIVHAAAAQDQSSQRWFEDVTHKAGVAARHHTRRFDNPYAEIMQGYTKLGAGRGSC